MTSCLSDPNRGRGVCGSRGHVQGHVVRVRGDDLCATGHKPNADHLYLVMTLFPLGSLIHTLLCLLTPILVRTYSDANFYSYLFLRTDVGGGR